MSNRLINMNVLLRSEAFGGLVFDPAQGTLLHLDHEGFRIAEMIGRGKLRFLDPRKRRFANRLRQELNWHSDRQARLIATETAHWQSDEIVPTLIAPTLVDFQITNLCNMGCPHCYASSHVDGEHVSWDDLKAVVQQLYQNGVCQLAIGGGEPLLHPDIVNLLHLCCDYGVVPNMTTGGMDFTEDKLQALRDCCGAVGLSLEGVGERYNRCRSKLGFDGFIDAVEVLKAWCIPTVLQIVLSQDNLADLPDMVAFCRQYPHLYGVIFLAYKPIGRGKVFTKPLAAIEPERVSREVGKAFKQLSPHMRVGYDCCMTPAIAGVEKQMAFGDISHLEGCSGMRGSCGVLPNLDVIPCTFTPGLTMGNLHHHTLSSIWQGEQAEAFRGRFEKRLEENLVCGKCTKQHHCYAGCPVMDLVHCQS